MALTLVSSQQQEKPERRVPLEKVENAIVWSDGTITIKNVRASYPHIFHRFEANGKTGKYGIVGLMPKTAEYFPAKNLIRDFIQQMIRENKLKDIPAGMKFLRDGDLSGKPEYEKMYEIHASEDRRPDARDNRRDPATKKARILKPDEDKDRIYAGCWVNILIKPWFQNHVQYGKRVNANLVAVQFVADDESFGQGRVGEAAVDESFDDIDESSGYDDDLGDEL